MVNNKLTKNCPVSVIVGVLELWIAVWFGSGEEQKIFCRNKSVRILIRL